MAGANRLQLDFKLVTTEERTNFLNEYLQRPEFIKKPPTEDELETMGNYLLWGKDPTTGLNAKQAGLVEMETKHGTWDKNGNTESLEGLMESPTFNEASLMPLESIAPTKIKREVFSRKEALSKCPDYMVDTYRNLFRHIDELDLMINYYELAHNRRKNPPRADLVNKFTEEEQSTLQEKITHWNQYKYLKKRHELVELRREQYTLRDFYQETILTQDTTPAYIPYDEPAIDVDIEVLPLGVKRNQGAGAYLFGKWEEIIPANMTEEKLEQISDLYWRKKNYIPTGQQQYIDFRELEHVYEMFQLFFELDDAAAFAELDSNLPALMETLRFYVEQAELSEIQREILDLKLKKVKNVDIALEINKKWKKTYTPNYISTIFRQRIIPKINEAAAYHEKLVSNIFFEEEFKVCTGCGKTFLRDADNFTRKARSKDGFTSRCKKCEKEARQGRDTTTEID